LKQHSEYLRQRSFNSKVVVVRTHTETHTQPADCSTRATKEVSDEYLQSNLISVRFVSDAYAAVIIVDCCAT